MASKTNHARTATEGAAKLAFVPFWHTPSLVSPRCIRFPTPRQFNLSKSSWVRCLYIRNVTSAGKDYKVASVIKFFKRAVQALEKRPWMASFLGLLIFGGIAAVDLLTPEQLSFAFFYLIPIALLLWFPGRWLAWLIAASSAFLWLADHLVRADFDYLHSITAYWEPVVRFCFYAVFILGLTKLREYLARLRTGNSELRAALAALHEAEQRYREIFENSSSGVALFDVTPDLRFKVVGINPAVERMTGLVAADVAGKFVEEALPAETARRLIANYTQCVQAGSPMFIRDAIVFPAGLRLFETSLVPVHDPAGRVHRLITLPVDVTDKNRAEEALRESERRYREIFDNSSDGIFMLEVGGDGQFRVLEINPAEERRLGMSSAAASGKRNDELVPAETAAHLDDNNRKCVAAGRPISFDDVVQLPTGRYEYHTTLAPVRDPAGRIYRIVGVSRDVTENRRMERALKQSEEKFSKSFHASPDSITISRLDDGALIEFNRGFIEAYGYTREEVVGRSAVPSDLGVWDDARDRERLVALLKKEGTVRGFEAKLRRKNGEIRYAVLSSSLVEIEGETCLLTMSRDTTEHRHMEEALRESEARYREIVENTSDGIFLVEVTPDLRFRLLSFNPAHERMLGVSAADAVGRFTEEYLPRELADKVNEDKRRCIETGVPISYEEMLDLPIGRKYYHTTLVPVRDQSGKIARLIGVTRDLTEKKRAEERERVHEQELFQASKLASLGTLVSGIAHEINNPNNFIRLNVQNLKEFWLDLRSILHQAGTTDGSPSLHGVPIETARGMVEDLLSGIEEGSKRIEKLLKNLRDFARGDDGELTEEVDVNAATESAVLMTRNLIQKSTDSFSIRQAGGLPAVRGNQHQIEQVVINLVTNACQSLAFRDRKVAVTTSLDGDWILIEVADEGIGIPPENLARVTDPFFTTKRANGGSGLGLAVTSRIVSNHGGTINFSSQIGAGTRVSIRLPAVGGRR